MTDDEFLNDRDTKIGGQASSGIVFPFGYGTGYVDTPRTNAFRHGQHSPVLIEHACTLERELAAARAELADNERALKLCRAWSSRAEKAEAELERARKVIEAAKRYRMLRSNEAGQDLCWFVDELEAGR